jgi:hypothetical protein
VPVPLTSPVESTVATEVLLVVHVPPDGELVSVIVEPMHSVLLPPVMDGAASMVIGCGV